MIADSFIVACVQLNPGDDRASNVERAEEAVRAAAARGATFVALPEYVGFLHASGSEMRKHALREEDDPVLQRLRKAAAAHGTWILVGSLALVRDGERLANRSFLVSDTGDVVARYDKIHMFDATLPGGRIIRESSTYAPGSTAVVATTPFARLGMSICYDLRFPALYRAMAQAGAELLLVPSAFTKATGTLHWQALLQARAIENGTYVLAPATCGTHPGGHQTYGHAMIIDPNGKILAEGGEVPDILYAAVDLAVVAAARSRLPSLTHDRGFALETVETKEHHEPI